MIGTLLTQGFQCASPEMTTAKVAIQNKDWAKAEIYLEKELDKNPQNTDAWLEMYKTKKALGKNFEAAKSLVNAEKSNPVDQKYKDQIAINSYQLWIKCYNDGINNFNKFLTTKNKSYFDTAIAVYDIGSIIRPEILDFYKLKGRAFEESGDTNKAISEYIKYKNEVEKDLQFLTSKKIYKFSNRNEITSVYGNPIESKGTKLGESDSSVVDYYKIDGKDVYLASIEKEKGTFTIDGWKVNPPASWIKDEKFQYFPIDLNPYTALAQIAFNRNELKQASEYTNAILQLDPNNTAANGFLIQIYDKQGNRDGALVAVKKLVDLNPGNKVYIAQYGEVLFKLEKYDEAIKQFDKALSIDPNFYTVMRNLAACYKNIAVIKQKKQVENKEKDKNYKLDPDEYQKDLTKSVKYFEDSRKSKDFKMDFTTLRELANLYDVLESSNKLSSVTSDIEKIENDIPDNQKEYYWLTLVRAYSNLLKTKSNDVTLKDKLNKAMAESDKFKK